MQLIKETTPDLPRWSVGRFGTLQYTESPQDRISRTIVGLAILPFALIVGLVVVASLITGSFYQWLRGR